LTLTCHKNATDGGDSMVVSCNAIYEYCKKNLKPDELDALFLEDAVTYDRAPDFAKKPVFWSDPNTGAVGMVWRKDLFVDKMDEVVNPKAHAGVKCIMEFLNDESNLITYKLQRNETLLCNNMAVLHARKGYPANQERVMDRMNFHTIGSGSKLDKANAIKPGFKRESRIATTRKIDNGFRYRAMVQSQ